MLLGTEWYDVIHHPGTIWAIVAIIGIISYTILSVTRMHHVHRERLAMIERGMNPDTDRHA